jgi:hypothetical protein
MSGRVCNLYLPRGDEIRIPPGSLDPSCVFKKNPHEGANPVDPAFVVELQPQNNAHSPQHICMPFPSLHYHSQAVIYTMQFFGLI